MSSNYNGKARNNLRITELTLNDYKTPITQVVVIEGEQSRVEEIYKEITKTEFI